MSGLISFFQQYVTVRHFRFNITSSTATNISFVRFLGPPLVYRFTDTYVMCCRAHCVHDELSYRSNDQ